MGVLGFVNETHEGHGISSFLMIYLAVVIIVVTLNIVSALTKISII